jgi:excisionase family DNA binding protein
LRGGRLLSQQSLVSISEASHTLGVSEAALRQWTDEGKIKAFITPGGHRRYSRIELKKFISSRQKLHSLKDLVAELEGTAQLHREIARLYLSSISWYNKLGRESQEHLADSSRRLLNLITKYITEPAKQEETIQLARDVGNEFGETLAKLGLPITDSIEAFILHRDPLMRAAAHMVRKKEGTNGRVVEAIPLIAHIMDEALVSLVAAHQNHWGNSQKGSHVGTTE